MDTQNLNLAHDMTFFYLWHHTEIQKGLDFGEFLTLDFWIRDDLSIYVKQMSVVLNAMGSPALNYGQDSVGLKRGVADVWGIMGLI